MALFLRVKSQEEKSEPTQFVPLKEKTKRLDSSDCPLEAGVAFPFDLVQLWLLLTSSSHALSQGCVRSLSTVREVEISHVDTEECPRRSG